MIKLRDLIFEEGGAGEEAKRRGLKSIGFGRYVDPARPHVVVAKSKGGKLVAVKGAEAARDGAKRGVPGAGPPVVRAHPGVEPSAGPKPDRGAEPNKLSGDERMARIQAHNKIRSARSPLRKNVYAAIRGQMKKAGMDPVRAMPDDLHTAGQDALRSIAKDAGGPDSPGFFETMRKSRKEINKQLQALSNGEAAEVGRFETSSPEDLARHRKNQSRRIQRGVKSGRLKQ